MERTRLVDRSLPVYTRGEEIFNMVSHIIGGAFGVLALISCILVAASDHNAMGIVTSVIYGISLITLYTMSSIYHGLRTDTSKKVMQIMDHCTIFFLIAGTYTPILLCCIREADPAVAWILMGLEWGLAALGITLNAIDLKKFRVFSMIAYIGAGWGILLAFRTAVEAIPARGFFWLAMGGIVYTLGTIFYGLGKKVPYMHAVFHIFVLLGSIFQYICIIGYIL